MQALIQSNVNKAYVALQASTSTPADTALPGVINTRRPTLSNRQIAARYLKSIAGNPDIDIAKVSSMVVRDRVEHALPLSLLDPRSEAPLPRNANDEGDGENRSTTMRKRGVAERSATLGSGYQWQVGNCPDWHWALPQCRSSSGYDGGIDNGYFETIGPVQDFSSKCSVTFLDPSLFGIYESKFPLSKDPYMVTDEGDPICENTHVLADAELCSRLALRGFKNCSVFSTGDQLDQIDAFLHGLPNDNDTLIVLRPDVIERWGITRFQQKNKCAYALRSKIYRMKVELFPMFGSMAGLMIIGLILVNCRKRVADSVHRVKQAAQRCFDTLAPSNNDAPGDDSNENPVGNNSNDADVESSTVIDMNGANTKSSSACLSDFSSSSAEKREAESTVKADDPLGQAKAASDFGETSDVPG